MTEKLIALFSSTENALWRARCASGVRLEFLTDAENLELAFEFGVPVRDVFTCDIVVDGQRMTTDGAGPHKLTLMPGEKHIVIHLPHLVILEDICLKLSRDSRVEPLPVPARRLLFCGDSICQGMVTTTPSAAIAPLTAAALDMDFVNTSVGGARMRAEHVQETMAIPGDILILALGVNNVIAETPWEALRQDTEAAVAALAAFPGGKVVILPIPNLAGSAPDLARCREIIRECAGQYPGIHILDGYSFFPARPELYCDGVHPNDEGSRIYAGALSRFIAGKQL